MTDEEDTLSAQYWQLENEQERREYEDWLNSQDPTEYDLEEMANERQD